MIVRKDTIELFTKYKVYTERELQSRLAILAENYVKTVTIEGKLTAFMARTMILPAALRYQAEVATAVNATKAAGVENSAQADLLRSLTGTITRVPEGDGGPGPRHGPPRRGRAARPRQVLAGQGAAGDGGACGRWATSWRASSPTTCGRCRPTARCCSSSEDIVGDSE